MNKKTIETLDDIAPFVKEHLLPEIHDSVEVCVSSFEADDYNDSWTFGTQLWRNIWNRFVAISNFNDCPFDVCGKGNEYKLQIGPYMLEHHRINEESRLPNGAKAVKTLVVEQLSILSLLGNTSEIRPIENIIIAIDANPDQGLKEVFLGEMIPFASNSKKFKWGKMSPLYLAKGEKASIDEIRQISTPFAPPHVPVEKVPEVQLRFVKTDITRKDTK